MRADAGWDYSRRRLGAARRDPRVAGGASRGDPVRAAPRSARRTCARTRWPTCRRPACFSTESTSARASRPCLPAPETGPSSGCPAFPRRRWSSSTPSSGRCSGAWGARSTAIPGRPGAPRASARPTNWWAGARTTCGSSWSCATASCGPIRSPAVRPRSRIRPRRRPGARRGRPPRRRRRRPGRSAALRVTRARPPSTLRVWPGAPSKGLQVGDQVADIGGREGRRDAVLIATTAGTEPVGQRWRTPAMHVRRPAANPNQ